MGPSLARTPIALAIAVGLAACHAYGQRPQDEAEEITVAAVETKSVTITHDYPCAFYGQNYTDVRAPADGFLAAVVVKENQRVKRGDLLLKIRPPTDDETSRADEPDRMAAVEAGRAVMADNLFHRMNAPGDKTPIAVDPDGIIAIKAPSDGVLGPLAQRPGRFVRKNDLLTIVVRTDTIWAEFDVAERDLADSSFAWIQDPKGPRLNLILADKTRFTHAGESCGPQGGRQSRTGIRFLGKFPNPDGLRRGGRSGTVSVTREWKDAVYVPRRAALIEQPGQTHVVFVVDKDHVAHRRKIVTGDGTREFLMDKEILIVKEGVSPGDRIVVDGVKQVRDGDKVE